MTSKELDERILDIHDDCFEAYPAGYFNYDKAELLVKQLIRDCIAAVVPEYGEQKDYSEVLYHVGFNDALELLQANTKEPLGDKDG